MSARFAPIRKPVFNGGTSAPVLSEDDRLLLYEREMLKIDRHISRLAEPPIEFAKVTEMRKTNPRAWRQLRDCCAASAAESALEAHREEEERRRREGLERLARAVAEPNGDDYDPDSGLISLSIVRRYEREGKIAVAILGLALLAGIAWTVWRCWP
jgi:hypothetical protein